MVRTKYFSVVIAALLMVLATGCIVSFEPRTAVNPVGTEHTVTVTLDDETELDEEEICEIYVQVIEEIIGEEAPEDICEEGFPDTADEEHIVHFEVIQGPNTGMNSDDDGECEPSCFEPDEDGEISWTYQSNGIAGTDVIQVCQSVLSVLPILLPTQEEPTDDEFERIIVEAINRALGTHYESIEDALCETVTKTWQEPQRPNIGAGLSGLFQGPPTALPTAPAPAAVAPAQTTIRPPSTGDAGLK